MSHMSVVTCVLFSCAVVFVPCVFVLCVLPRIPFFLKKKQICWGREGSGKVGSDGLKWCPHKVISAHMLACTAGNRP